MSRIRASTICLMFAQCVQAQTTPIGITDGTYFEGFNSMGTVTSTYPVGWNGYKISGSGLLAAGAFISAVTVPPFVVSDGGSNIDSVYNYGALLNSDRALGSLAGSQEVCGFGIVMVNNTGRMLTGGEILMSVRAEQWRAGSANNANENWVFEYKTGGALQDMNELNSIGWTAVPTFDLNEIQTGSSGSGALDGNATGNFYEVSGPLTGLIWNAGDRLVLRWRDANDPGNNAGMAVDLFTFIVGVPEPSTYLMCGMALLGFATLRRRRKPLAAA